MIKSNLIHKGNCLKTMKDFPKESVDLILTDPPYNLSQKTEKFYKERKGAPISRKKSPIKFDYGKWDNKSKNDYFKFTKDWLHTCCDLLKPNGTIISFFSKEDISYLAWTSEQKGIRTRTIFTWCKSNPVPQFRKKNYLSGTEYIWLGSKGEWTFNFKQQKEMKNYMITPNKSSYGKTKHPSEKSLKLIKYFIEIHTNENDVVFDPFCGSGTTLVGAKELNRKFIGIELEEDYYDIAKNRVKKAKNFKKETNALF